MNVSDAYLLSVKVSTNTASTVTKGVGSEDNDVLSVGGNLELGTDDLDGSFIHELNLGNEFSSILSTNDSWERFSALVIDLNLEFGLAIESVSLLVLGQFNLGLSSKEKDDFLLLGSDVLNHDGDGLTSGTVLSQNVVTVIGDLGVELEMGKVNCEFDT